MSPDSGIKLDCKFARRHQLTCHYLFYNVYIQEIKSLVSLLFLRFLVSFYAKTRTLFHQTVMH